MKKLHIALTGVLAAATITLAVDNHQTSKALDEYKLVYDGLTIFEDGSWTYDDEEYWFWNWTPTYVE